jgi:hypothetical protein
MTLRHIFLTLSVSANIGLIAVLLFRQEVSGAAPPPRGDSPVPHPDKDLEPPAAAKGTVQTSAPVPVSPLYSLPAPAPGYTWSPIKDSFYSYTALDENSGELMPQFVDELHLTAQTVTHLRKGISQIIDRMRQDQLKAARLVTESNGEQYFIIPPDASAYQSYKSQLAGALADTVDPAEASRIAAFVMCDQWFRSVLRETAVAVTGTETNPTFEIRFIGGDGAGGKGGTYEANGFFKARFGNLFDTKK